MSEYSRQSFLGKNAQSVIEQAVIGIVGLGGGGSHIVQQLAHVGFLNYLPVDPDVVEATNLNRLVGAQVADIGKPKTVVAQRTILGLRPQAEVGCFQKRWQDCAERLRSCDIIFGAVDGFRERRDLEAFCRRYLIPLIDVGMDVSIVEPEPPQMNGQVIISMPGFACMTCMGFLSDDKLEKEALRYGNAGVNPQVIWPNGVLASVAVGYAVDLLTDWSRAMRRPPYISYRGNTGDLGAHPRVRFIKLESCPHFPLTQIGPPQLRAV